MTPPRIFTASPQLSLGWLTWSTDRPLGTLIAKALFDVHGDGILRPAAEPWELAHDQPAEGRDGGEIAYPSDFVPFKRSVDVLMSGSAVADEPDTRIDVRLTLAALDRRVTAESFLPATRIPLREGLLRDIDGHPARLSARRGWRFDASELKAPVVQDRDFGAAPPEQRLASLDEGAAFAAWGLFDFAPFVRASLPGVRPWAFALGAEGGDPFPLTLDTVWLDGELGQVALVWRGARYLDELGDREILVGLGPARPSPWTEVGWRRGSAEEAAIATPENTPAPPIEARVFRDEPTTSKLDPSELDHGGTGVADPGPMHLPTGVPFSPSTGAAPPPRVEPRAPTEPSGTVTLDRRELVPGLAWPFGGGSASADERSPSTTRIPREGVEAPLGGPPEVTETVTLPRSAFELPPAHPFALPSAGATPRPSSSQTSLEVETPGTLASTDRADTLVTGIDAVPTVAEPTARTDTPPRATLDAPRSPPTEPSGGRAPLEKFVAVRIALERDSNEAAVLAAAGLDATSWLEIERAWNEHVAANADAARKVRAAMREERRALDERERKA